MEKNPKISIIIPVYNTEQYLRAAVESVINQTYENKEIILVDDGSTDSSPKICDEYGSQYSYIKVIHQDNAGLSAARNAGITNSKGEYIAFLDSDDEYGNKDMIAHYAHIFINNPTLDLIQFPTMWYWNDNKKHILGNVQDSLTDNINIGQNYSSGRLTGTACDKIYNRQLFNLTHFSEGRYFEDVWFITDIIPNLHHIYIDNFGFYKYKIRGGSITQSKYSALKSKHKIETSLKSVRTIICYCKDSYYHVNGFIQLQDCFLRYNLEHNSKSFEDLQKQIVEILPSIKGLAKNIRHISFNKTLQILLTKAFGIKMSIRLYNLKNSNTLK